MTYDQSIVDALQNFYNTQIAGFTNSFAISHPNYDASTQVYYTQYQALQTIPKTIATYKTTGDLQQLWQNVPHIFTTQAQQNQQNYITGYFSQSDRGQYGGPVNPAAAAGTSVNDIATAWSTVENIISNVMKSSDRGTPTPSVPSSNPVQAPTSDRTINTNNSTPSTKSNLGFYVILGGVALLLGIGYSKRRK